MKRKGKIQREKNPASFVHGPSYFDCLNERWSKGEVLGLLGASGVGKTEIVLDIFKGILKNNPTGIVCFVSLEMTTQKIAERWFTMIDGDDEISERFYVISNYDNDGKAKALTAHDINIELHKYKTTLNQDILCFAIDHLHIIEKTERQDLNSTCQQVKNMAVQNKSLAILLSQVPKSIAGGGMVPLDGDASFGCSQFKWIASYVMQIHRPVLKVEDELGFSVLAWGYAKVREQHKNDEVKPGQNKMLVYDQDIRQLRKMNRDEFSKFKNYYDKVLEMRENEENNKAFAYDYEEQIIGKDGKAVKLSQSYQGEDYLAMKRER